MTRCVQAYCRVSTSKQADEGVSLAAQEGRIRAWCLANGHELAQVHVDAGLSGGRADNRPALQDALSAACRQKAVLCVYSLSRLARSTKDTILMAERLDKAGADLVSLTDQIDTTSAAGKMMFRMMAVLAEFERDLVGERTAAALDHMKRTGKVYNHAPYGFRVEGDSLVPVPAEQDAIRLMRELREDRQSFAAIAAALVGRSVPAKQGGRWDAKTVARILGRVSA